MGFVDEPFLQAQSLFSDSFDEDRSADWIIYDDSVDGVSDATVQFAHDYSQDQFAFTMGRNPIF